MSIKERFIEEAQCYSDGLPITFSNGFRLLFFNMGFQLNISYRINKRLHKVFGNKRVFWLIPAIFQYIIKIMFGSFIAPQAKIGKRLRIFYGTGIIIGAEVVVGDDVQIFKDVTLGSSFPGLPDIKQPRIGNNVFIGTGAKILGDVTIGANVKVGANAVVLNSYGPDVTVVGVPAKIIKPKVDIGESID